jgi:hypothetical protein
MVRYGATDVTCCMTEFCVHMRLSIAEQAASLVTRFQLHLDTMHYTLLNVYMMCISFLVSVLLTWLSLYQPEVFFLGCDVKYPFVKDFSKMPARVPNLRWSDCLLE